MTQQKPQLIAQTLPRPMINHLIQVLSKSAAPDTNSPQIPTLVPTDRLGVVFGEELLASNGVDKAG